MAKEQRVIVIVATMDGGAIGYWPSDKKAAVDLNSFLEDGWKVASINPVTPFGASSSGYSGVGCLVLIEKEK